MKMKRDPEKMNDEDLFYLQYEMIRANLKDLVNFDDVSYLDFLEFETCHKVKFMVKLKKRILKQNEEEKKYERI